MTATQVTSDKKIVDSLLVDSATGRNLSLMLSNSRDASLFTALAESV